jgi:hypothetical protein
MGASETERFTGFAGRYDAGRPGHPPEVVERVVHGLGVCARAAARRSLFTNRTSATDFTKAFGDVIRRFATDDTELRRGGSVRLALQTILVVAEPKP